ncbi:hypothetical protein E9840_11700 [Tissierella creatinini]|nr:hypothetical protein E9840_11700 [Tissierella creatinini]TJX60844.1 hypothetical protein E8P77_19515 [Soehngenia saccharolytica]
MEDYLKKNGRIEARTLALSWVLIILLMFLPIMSTASEMPKSEKTTLVFIVDNSTYTVNGNLMTMDVSPQIVEGRTMLPIKYAASPLGAEVLWDGAERKVTVSLGETKMDLWIGQNLALINGKSVPIDPENPNVKPLIIKDRTMLPLRFITENLGCELQWDQATRKVTITKDSTSGTKLPDIKIPDIKQPELIKPHIDISKIISPDLTRLIPTWGLAEKGKAYKVTSSEADIPVVMRIGRGYNVFGKYASVESLKQSVLDTAKLIKDQRMERIRIDQGGNSQITSESIRSYSNQISTKLGASGSYFGFGGSVSSNFDSSRTEKLNNYFSTYSYIVQKYGVYVTGSTNLKNYLNPEAKSMINNNSISADTVFDNYGHYVLVDSITGGRVDYSITANSKSSTSYENFKIATKADFNVAIFKAGGSAEYQSVKNKSSYDSNKQVTLNSYGGGFTLNTGQFLNDPQILSKWEATLEESGTLVEFGNTTAKALVPIWELCDDSNRANYLKAEFEKLNLAHGNQWPMEKYVTDIVFVSGKNQMATRSLCPPGYMLVDADLNAGAGGNFIYLCYKLGENIDEAITDLFLEYTGSGAGADSGYVNHNANYAVYTRIASDLNQGSGGGFIYLWYSKEKTLPPIKDVGVAFNDPSSANPEWDTVLWNNSQSPADVNKSVGGKYIYIKFTR